VTDAFDAVVVGAGPAGSTAAALIAEAGHRVALLDREPGPTFKVGESLMPYSYHSLVRSGALDRLKASDFQLKRGVRFFSASGRGSTPFYFTETDPHERSTTWHVVRSEFDSMLIDHAAARGADVRLGTRVLRVHFEDGRAVGVRARTGDGAESDLSAGVVVDATGHSAQIARRLGLQQIDPGLRKVSIYTHFEGAGRDPGIEDEVTLILRTGDRRAWFWFIPFSHDRASVGVVGDLEHLSRNRGRPQLTFDEEVEKCPALRERLRPGRQLFPARVTPVFSYRSRQVAGDGWVLAGDALGFLDPMYSSGVMLALKSGEWAADAIVEGLQAGDLSAKQLGGWGDRFMGGMDTLRKLIYAFYAPGFSFGRFVRAHPECEKGLVDMLVGNVFDSGAEWIFGPMSRMCRLPAAWR